LAAGIDAADGSACGLGEREVVRHASASMSRMTRAQRLRRLRRALRAIL
jgi:hypothetical protein